ncbi:MAG: type IX secretion system protein PorQ [Chitinophagales bacterium]|nr:type IX secretion system protein PorQ [Chitinophagales bacterium]
MRQPKPSLLKRHLLATLCLMLLFWGNTKAQVGGNSVYDFIDLPASARITGAGGNLMATKDNDLSLAYHNPSLLNPSMHNTIIANTALYMGGIKHGYFAYARDYAKIATFQAGMQFISYGQFNQTDENGNLNGQFRAGEFALNLGASKQVEKYSFGGNLKFIYSGMESYHSGGMALDLAAAYHDTAKMFTASILVKNIGFQFKPYVDGNREQLPFALEAGFSKRLKFIPFRIGVIIHDIQQFDLRYEDPNANSNDDLLLGDTTSNEEGGKVGEVFDNIARHFIINGELYIAKVVRIGFGYNHQRRAELAADAKKGLSGFSFGLGITIKQFQFSFARARYSGRAATTQFTVGIDLNKFVKKKKE